MRGSRIRAGWPEWKGFACPFGTSQTPKDGGLRQPGDTSGLLATPRFSLNGGLGFLKGWVCDKDPVHMGHFHQRLDPVLHSHQYKTAAGRAGLQR